MDNESSQSSPVTSKMSSPSDNEEKEQTNLILPPTIPADNAILAASCYNYYKCRRALVEFIIKDGLTFRIVESEGFRSFCRQMEPRFELPDCMAIYSDLFLIYKDEKVLLKDYFKESKQTVSLTTDTWTSPNNLNYMCVTVHYVDEDWKFQKRIIMFCQVKKGLTGKAIGHMLERCLLLDWGLENVFSVTLDKVNDNAATIDYLKARVIGWTGATERAEYINVRCAAHVLGLVIKDVLRVYSKSIGRIRSVVKYATSSPARLAKFRYFAWLSRVDYKGGLILDVKNKWNNTYLMLDVAEKYERVFKWLEWDDKEFKKKFIFSEEDMSLELPDASGFDMSISDDEDLSSSSSSSDSESDGEVVDTSPRRKKQKITNTKNRKPRYAPCAKDWAFARGLVKLLKVFFDSVVEFSASTQVTAHSFLWQLVIIHEHLVEFRDNAASDPVIASMSNLALLKYKEHWGAYENMNSSLFFALLFDPRAKERGLEFSLDCLFEKDHCKVVSVMKKVKQELVRLFEEYKSMYSVAEKESTSVVNIVDTRVVGHRERVEAMLNARRKRFMRNTSGVGESTELDRYLMDVHEPDVDNFDILAWWQTNSTKYKILSHMAKDILAMPVSSVASESAFRTGKCVLDPWRSSLSSRTVEALLCTQSWLQHPIALDLLCDYVPVDTSSAEEELLGPMPRVFDL